MQRDLKRLGTTHFDLLVVGGGIYGASLAREASLREISTALVEKGDFGSATSANSLKIIHGGLRYLQYGDLKRVRSSVWARRELLRIAPHLVRPLKCVVPTYGHGVRGREALALALMANDLVSWDRNRGLDPDRRIPCGRIISRRQCLKLLPGIEVRNLTGGAVWYDAFAHDTERLTLAFVLAADLLGACAANYVRAESLLIEGDTVKGIHAFDLEKKNGFEIRAQVVVNAAGFWAGRLLTSSDGSGAIYQNWARALNLVLKRPLFKEYAAGFAGTGEFKDRDALVQKGTRFFFCVPWRDGSIIGTTYEVHEGSAAISSVTVTDIQKMLDEFNLAYPPADLSLDDVSHYHIGLVPLEGDELSNDGDVRVAKKNLFCDHRTISGLKGLITVQGVKYTNAVEMSRRVVDRVQIKLHRSVGRSREINYLPEAEVIKQEYDLRTCVVHAMENEMALHLRDVIFRRIGFGAVGYPEGEIVARCADIMAAALNWTAGRRQSEIEGLRTELKIIK